MRDKEAKINEAPNSFLEQNQQLLYGVRNAEKSFLVLGGALVALGAGSAAPDIFNLVPREELDGMYQAGVNLCKIGLGGIGGYVGLSLLEELDKGAWRFFSKFR